MKEDTSGPLWVKAANITVVRVRDVPYRHIVVPGWDIDVGHTEAEQEIDQRQITHKFTK